MRTLRTLSLCSLAALFVPDVHAQTCGVPGTGGLVPRISITTELWDSSGELVLDDGRPGAAWAWVFDDTPGPTPTPFGLACIAGSPAATVLVDAIAGGAPPLDANGSFRGSLTVPHTALGLVGRQLHSQAIVLDPLAANGVATSDVLDWKLRGPRLGLAARRHPPTEGFLVGDALHLRLGQSSGQVAVDAHHQDLAFHPDGRHVFSIASTDAFSILNFATGDAVVRCWDFGVAPPSLVAEFVENVPCATPPCLRGTLGIALTQDGEHGFFTSMSGAVVRFDADPTSPTLLQTTGQVLPTYPQTSSFPNDDVLVLPGDERLLAWHGSSGAIVDAASMTVIAAWTALLPTGWAEVVVSKDGSLAATLFPGLPGAPVVEVVDLDPTSPTFATVLSLHTLDGAGPHDLVFDAADPSNATLLVMTRETLSSGAPRVTFLDWPTGQQSHVVVGPPQANVGQPGSIATTGNGAFVYVHLYDDRTVRVFERSTMTLVAQQFVGLQGTLVLEGHSR